MDTKRINFSTIMCLILIVFSSIYFVMSFRYTYWLDHTPAAGFLPRWTGGILLGLSILCFFQSLRESGLKLSEVLPKGSSRINLLIMWGMLIFFALFAKLAGFMVTSLIMLTVLFSRGYKWQKAVTYSIIVTLVCYFLFKTLLQVPVPTNKLGW